MSDKKTYTAEEVGRAILKKAEEMLKNSPLVKANTAHEIEEGDEPNNEEAQCPEYLAEADIEEEKDQKKKKLPVDEIPEHEQHLDEEEKEIHDATEMEDDQEEIEEEQAAAKQKEEDEDIIEADEEEQDDEKDVKDLVKDVVDKKPLKDKEDKEEKEVEKALFKDKLVAVDKTVEYVPNKADVACAIKCAIKNLQELKDLKYTVENECPEAKQAFEDKYKQCKKEIAKLAKQYASMKKSIETEVARIENDEIGITKLKKFLDSKEDLKKSCMTEEELAEQDKIKAKKKADKNKKMEKFLGMAPKQELPNGPGPQGGR